MLTTTEKITRLSLMASKYREAVSWSKDPNNLRGYIIVGCNQGLCALANLLFNESEWIYEFKPLDCKKGFWWEWPSYLRAEGKPILPALQIRYEFLLSTIEKLKENI